MIEHVEICVIHYVLVRYNLDIAKPEEHIILDILEKHVYLIQVLVLSCLLFTDPASSWDQPG